MKKIIIALLVIVMFAPSISFAQKANDGYGILWFKTDQWIVRGEANPNIVIPQGYIEIDKLDDLENDFEVFVLFQLVKFRYEWGKAEGNWELILKSHEMKSIALEGFPLKNCGEERGKICEETVITNKDFNGKPRIVFSGQPIKLEDDYQYFLLAGVGYVYKAGDHYTYALSKTATPQRAINFNSDFELRFSDFYQHTRENLSWKIELSSSSKQKSVASKTSVRKMLRDVVDETGKKFKWDESLKQDIKTGESWLKIDCYKEHHLEKATYYEIVLEVFNNDLDNPKTLFIPFQGKTNRDPETEVNLEAKWGKRDNSQASFEVNIKYEYEYYPNYPLAVYLEIFQAPDAILDYTNTRLNTKRILLGQIIPTPRNRKDKVFNRYDYDYIEEKFSYEISDLKEVPHLAWQNVAQVLVYKQDKSGELTEIIGKSIKRPGPRSKEAFTYGNNNVLMFYVQNFAGRMAKNVKYFDISVCGLGGSKHANLSIVITAQNSKEMKINRGLANANTSIQIEFDRSLFDQKCNVEITLINDKLEKYAISGMLPGY